VSPESAEEQKPGFVVDGQQRLAAVRDANVPTFLVAVTAFVTDDVAEQTEQFILVNSTKPLPKGLIYELLPATDGHLPSLLRRLQFLKVLLHRIRTQREPPLKARVQSPTSPAGVVQDNSLLRMIENSLSDGVLYRFRAAQVESADTGAMLDVLTAFWRAVRE